MSPRKLSETTAKNTLEAFFKGSASDSLTPAEIYANAGRANLDSLRNSAWLYNKLPTVRTLKLVTVHKEAINGKSAIVAITLTPAGKAMLGRGIDSKPNQLRLPDAKSQPQGDDRPAPRQVSLQSITDDIDEFMRQNPSWELELIPKRVSKGGMSTQT